MPYNRPIYNVDWKKIAIWLVPVRWRTKRLFAWLHSLTIIWSTIYTRFIYFRSNIVYQLKITPQVCYLEKMLNDRYDVVDRGIRIVDGVEYNAIPLFRKEEGKPVAFFRKIENHHQVLFTKAETGKYSVDFIVKVPLGVAFDTIALTESLKQNRLESKKFKIQIV